MNTKKTLFIPLVMLTSSLFAQFSGINTTAPGTALDVNGAITNRETAVAIVSNAATIPNNVSQVQLTGTATGTVSITAPAAPNAGQRLVIFNNTTGGFGATLNGVTIPYGKALEYVYSNSGWRSTDGGSVGATPVNIYTANGTLIGNRTVTQGTNTLTFTSNQVNAFSVDGNTFSVDAANKRIGIGTNAPNAPLHLSSGITSAITSSFLTPGMLITGPTAGPGSGFTGPGLYFEGLNNPVSQRVIKVNMTSNGTTGFLNFQSVSDNGATAGGSILSMLSTGNVGIGTMTPFAKLHINGSGGSISSTAGGQSYFNAGSDLSIIANGSWATPLSIYATSGILSQSFIASQAGTFTASDIRIKDLKNLSNSSEDLATINKVEITNYTMKDKLRFGDKAYKKVIAQQVELVYPQAITKRVDYIPNVYALSEKVVFDNGQMTITLSKAHKIKTGDEVKMLTESGEEVFATVTSVNTLSFTVNHVDNKQPQYFVYGIKVNDFLTIDYDAISMLNVSATQELTKKVAALELDNETLKAQNARLAAYAERAEAKDKTYAKLTAQVKELQQILGVKIETSVTRQSK